MPKLAIIGSTGAVGLELCLILNTNLDIHYDELTLYSSESSVGKKQIVRGKEYIVRGLIKEAFTVDYAILAVSPHVASLCVKYRDEINPKCIIIDNSSAFRMDSKIPLIIPEINMDHYKNETIIANPNCSTIILLMILAPLYRKNPIKQVDVATYQASSGAGLAGMNELMDQTKELCNGVSNENLSKNVFKKQLAFNAFSHNTPIDCESGFNEEEIKMIKETHKILNDSSIKINPTCVRIPTLRSHMEAVTITFKNSSNVATIKTILKNTQGVIILDDPESNQFPEPIISENKDEIYVGRIRQSYHKNKNTFQLLISGDQIRKGASLNAIQIYQQLILKQSSKQISKQSSKQTNIKQSIAITTIVIMAIIAIAINYCTFFIKKIE